MIQKKTAKVTPGKPAKFASLNSTDPSMAGVIENHVDYYRSQSELVSHDRFKYLLLKIMGQDAFNLIQGAKFTDYPGDQGYASKATGEHNQSILWSEVEGGVKMRINLPGDYCSTCTTNRSLVKLMIELRNYGFRETRIDLAVTDYSKIFKWEDIAEAADNRDFTNYSNHRYLDSYDCSKGWGATLNLGSPESENFIRFYETRAKHGFPANRAERVFKGRQCRYVCDQLIRTYNNSTRRSGFLEPSEDEKKYVNDELTRYIGQASIGGFDFVDKRFQQTNGTVKNCPELPWWTKFKEALGGQVKMFMERHKPTVAKTQKWMKRQVSGILALFNDTLSPDQFSHWLDDLICHGRKKASANDNIKRAELFEKGLRVINEEYDYILHPT